MAVEQRTTSS